MQGPSVDMDRTLKSVNYKVGGTQTPYSFTETQYFLIPEGMTQFDVFHNFVENSVKSEFLFFWALLKGAKIWNSSKNACIWEVWKPSSSELQKRF